MFKENLFKNKTFLVTGASSGIGADVALMLNELGAKIIAVARDEKKLLEQQKKVKNKDNFLIISKDLSLYQELDKWALKLSKDINGFDGAILSAGISLPLGLNAFDYIGVGIKTFNINYFANMQILKGLVDKRSKIKDEASFVLISSAASKKPGKGMSLYGASKAAIDTSIKSLALEFAPKYRINSILPGYVSTPMVQNNSQRSGRDLNAIQQFYPLGIGKVENISPLICFLLSKGSSWITGQNFVIDGGGGISITF
ncbi:short-chain dehydrogenase [Campylobacter ornithocola]|uniref:Short-chain dehydrogenase n=1 Tax=Campylobacter ornithocola TaxID=1848766 RepID=A0AA91FY81_9BACT|nr:short-chain dehydrogenase [Campylobacter ornithocola]